MRDRDHILQRLALLADAVIHTSNAEDRNILARAALRVALNYHPLISPAKGSP